MAIRNAGNPEAYYQSNEGACRAAMATMGSGGINLMGASCARGGNYNAYFKTVNTLIRRCMYTLNWKIIQVQ